MRYINLCFTLLTYYCAVFCTSYVRDHSYSPWRPPVVTGCLRWAKDVGMYM